MRVLLVAPFAADAIRGNRIAADRIARHLRQLGVEILAADAAQQPDLVHGFQVAHCGERAAHLADRFGVPLLLSFRGSDAEEHLDDPGRRARIAAAVGRAQLLTVLTRHHARRVATRLVPRAPIEVVEQGVAPAPSARDWRRELKLPASAPLLAQVTSIRRMKSFPQVLTLLDGLHATAPAVTCVVAGPVLEPDLGPVLRSWAAARPWAQYAGPLRPPDAQALIRAATVTLHTGRREGTSNALLESLALATPALVLATPQTTELLQHRRDVLLFRTDREAAEGLRALLQDPGGASAMAAAGQRWVRMHGDPVQEAARYLACYERALRAAGP